MEKGPEPDANGWYCIKDIPIPTDAMVLATNGNGLAIAVYLFDESDEVHVEKGWFGRVKKRSFTKGGRYMRQAIPTEGSFLSLVMRSDNNWRPTHWRHMLPKPVAA
jgi:hypothetical protein